MGRPIHEIFNENLSDNFCDRYSILTRVRTVNKTLISEKTAERNKYIAYQLGWFKRSFKDRLDKTNVENYNETHMILDMDNGRRLTFPVQREYHITIFQVFGIVLPLFLFKWGQKENGEYSISIPKSKF